ncbi:hypothetical protein DFS34DRAFT_185812 [Phlyctochytrium arcticum]|nr:hypothetical protein DFS34DRAFT_185812 [Phlyctochytrium arcticum]
MCSSATIVIRRAISASLFSFSMLGTLMCRSSDSLCATADTPEYHNLYAFGSGGTRKALLPECNYDCPLCRRAFVGAVHPADMFEHGQDIRGNNTSSDTMVGVSRQGTSKIGVTGCMGGNMALLAPSLRIVIISSFSGWLE